MPRDDLQEVKSDIKELHVKVDTLIVVSTENKADLKNHMRRTELNEVRIEKLEKWLIGLLTSLLAATVLKYFI